LHVLLFLHLLYCSLHAVFPFLFTFYFIYFISFFLPFLGPEKSILELHYTVIFKMKHSSAHGSGHWSQAFGRGDPTSTSRPAYVTIVVDKLAKRQVASEYSVFPHQYLSTNIPHTFIYHRRYIILTTGGVVKQLTLKWDMLRYKTAIEPSDKTHVKRNRKTVTNPAPPQLNSLNTLCINVLKHRKIIKFPLTIAWDRTLHPPQHTRNENQWKIIPFDPLLVDHFKRLYKLQTLFSEYTHT
jgi:hypothetical protein